MIHKECWLNEMMLNIFLEEEVEDVASLMSCFKLDAFFLSDSLSFFICLDFIEVHACILLNSVNHCDSFKRLAKIHFDTIVNNLSGTKNCLCNMTVKIFCKVHHAMVVSVSLIEFHQSELGIMSCIKTFVTEYSADFVYSFHTANDKSLEVKFE